MSDLVEFLRARGNEMTDGIRNSIEAVADLPFWLLAIWAVAAVSFLVAVVKP